MTLVESADGVISGSYYSELKNIAFNTFFDLFWILNRDIPCNDIPGTVENSRLRFITMCKESAQKK